MIYLASLNGVSNRDYILRSLAASGKRLRRRRIPQAVFPRQAERKYLRELLKLSDEIHKETNRLMSKHLPDIMAEVRREAPVADGVGLDAWGERIAELIELLKSTVLGLIPDSRLTEMLDRVGQDVDKLNDQQHKRLLKTVLGVDVFASEPWLAAHMEAFVSANVSEIRGLHQRHADEVKQIIINGARQGLRHEEIAAEISRRPHLRLEKRSAYIARNQIAQFNASLDRTRQNQVGLESYIWRGILDERERPAHVAREGEHYLWEFGPTDGDHPGYEPNCRCVAEPDMTPFYDGEDAA